MDLPVLYEDADVVAIDKPAGLITHSDGRTEEPSAEQWFLAHYPGTDGGYVHRLDRDTSGVLLFAKHKAAYDFLRAAFHDRLVIKTYCALVYGRLKEKKGSVDFDIGRSRQDFRLRSAQPKAKGRLREALTEYEVLAASPEVSVVKLMPKTGRTHQLRVHMKAIHHPIVSDPLYAPNHKPLLGMHRLALHAETLVVPLPQGGSVQVHAPLPADLRAAIAQLEVDSTEG